MWWPMNTEHITLSPYCHRVDFVLYNINRTFTSTFACFWWPGMSNIKIDRLVCKQKMLIESVKCLIMLRINVNINTKQLWMNVILVLFVTEGLILMSMTLYYSVFLLFRVDDWIKHKNTSLFVFSSYIKLLKHWI